MAATGRFLPYLPQDNSLARNPEADAVVQSINEELEALLREDDGQFWETVVNDASLVACLDSYLRYQRRPYEEAQDCTASGAPAARQLLARNVLMVLLRLVTPCAPGGSGPTPARQSELVYEHWLLDVPKLLDAAVLYLPSNPTLLRRLLADLFVMQPRYADDVAAAAALATDNLGAVRQRCAGVVAALSGSEAAGAVAALTDGLLYMRDAAVSLAALAAGHPPCAAALASGAPQLVAVLAELHDGLIPAVQARLPVPDSPHATAQLQQLAMQLRPALVHLASLLLQGFLQPPQQWPTPGGTAAAAGGARPRAVGEAFMAALTMAAPSGSESGAPVLLQAVEDAAGLRAAVARATKQGILLLDGAQQDCLSVLLGGTMAAANGHAAALQGSNGAGVDDAVHRSKVAAVKELLPHYGDGFLAVALDTFDGDTERTIHALLEGGLPPALAECDPQLATPPHNGSGGVGGVGKGKAKVPAMVGKGKGKALAAAPIDVGNEGPSPALANLTWTGLAAEAKQLAASSASAASGSSSAAAPSGLAGSGGSDSAAARAVNRSTAKVMGRMRADERAAVVQAARASQWEADEELEYNDEMDDTFDEMLYAGDGGTADVEGDDDESEGARRRAAQSAAAGGRGGGGGGGAGRGGGGGRGRVWVLDGRIYNYPKQGAVEAGSQVEAQQVLAAQAMERQQIHGLGAGGNVPLPTAGDQGQQVSGDGRFGGRGGGRGGGRSGPVPAGAHGSGRGRGSYKHKGENKAAAGNHHRKDRAMRKQGIL